MPDRLDQTSPDRADEVAALAELLRNGNPRAALARCDELLGLHPGTPQLHNIRGAALAALDREDEATEAIRRAIDLQPDYAQAHHNLSLVLLQKGETDQAIAGLQNAVALQPDNAEMHNSLGTALFAAGKTTAAISALRLALELDPENLTFIKNLAQYLVDDKQDAIAQPLLQTAANLAPTDQDVRVVLGEVYSRLGRPTEAIEQFRHAADLNARDPDLFVRIGKFWRQNHAPEKEIDAFERAISFSPDFAPAYAELAFAHAERGEDERAIELYQKCLQLDPANINAQHLLAALKHDENHRTPEAYVTQLFDEYAARFEVNLQKQLRYSAPSELARLLASLRPDDKKYASVLDLGCGTGLFGEAIGAQTRRLNGVDLSPKMLEVARNKNIYASLTVADMAKYVRQDRDEHDLYACVDALIYIGDLNDLFQAVASRAKPKTLFAFTTEDLEGTGIRLQRTGRYAHSLTYIQTLCERYRLEILAAEPRILRNDGAHDIQGRLCVTMAR